MFGRSVAISGDQAIVGAYGEDAGGSSAGAAYVFERDSGSGIWGEVVKLTASHAQGGDQFGASVSIDGDRAIVAADMLWVGYDTPLHEELRVVLKR